MIPKESKAKDLIQRLRAELVAAAQELGTVKAERDSLRVALQDTQERAIRAEASLKAVYDALNEVAT